MDLFSAALTVGREVCPQLANMGLLYAAISLLNRRSRKHGDTAARQVRFQAVSCARAARPSAACVFCSLDSAELQLFEMCVYSTADRVRT